MGKGPTGLTFSHDGRFAFVSSQGDKTVGVIDTATHEVIKTIPVGANPHFMVVSRDGLSGELTPGKRHLRPGPGDA